MTRPLHSSKGQNDDHWHYVVWTRAASGANLLYLDGIQQDSAQDNGGSIATTRPIQVGTDTYQGGKYLDGTLDELRISSVVRGPGWIEAQHRSMTDASFVIYGLEEAGP